MIDNKLVIQGRNNGQPFAPIADESKDRFFAVFLKSIGLTPRGWYGKKSNNKINITVDIIGSLENWKIKGDTDYGDEERPWKRD